MKRLTHLQKTFLTGFAIVALFGQAFGQTEATRDILVGTALSSGFDIGLDSFNKKRDWLRPRDGYFELASPAGEDWAACFITFGPSTNPPRPFLDLSAFKVLRIEMRGAVGGEQVDVGIKTNTQLDDGSETKIRVTLSSNWETYTFPLDRFSGADLRRLYVVTEFVFSGPAAKTIHVRRVSYSSSVSSETPRFDSGTKVVVPSSAYSGSFTSLLVVLNLDNQPNTITITARRPDGSVVGTPIGTTIPVGGRFRRADLLGSMGATSGDFGPVTVESTNGRMLAAISEVVSGQGPAGFFPGFSTDSAFHRGFIAEVVDTGNAGTPGTFRTNLGVNTVGASPATVTISLHNDVGTELGSTTIIVPGNGMTQLDNVVRTLLGTGTFSGQTGYLKLVSDQPVIAWASKIENGTGDPSFQIGIAAAASTP